MRGVIQSRTGRRGTCFRASLASILNLREDQVPDFQAANQDPGVDKFLSKYGLRYEEFPITPDNAPVGYHFILGVSPRGGEHAIVGKDGKPVWDPHPASDGTGQGLVKPERYGVLVNEFERAKDASRADYELVASLQPTEVFQRNEYWQVGSDMYRNPVGNRGPIEPIGNTGKPGNARWECSVRDFPKMKKAYAKDSDPRTGVTKCQACGARLNGDDKLEVHGKVVCPDCADTYRRSKALDEKMLPVKDAKSEVVEVYKGHKIKRGPSGSISVEGLSNSPRHFTGWSEKSAVEAARAAIDKSGMAIDADSRRARLHRALDCIMDSRAKVKDAQVDEDATELARAYKTQGEQAAQKLWAEKTKGLNYGAQIILQDKMSRLIKLGRAKDAGDYEVQKSHSQNIYGVFKRGETYPEDFKWYPAKSAAQAAMRNLQGKSSSVAPRQSSKATAEREAQSKPIFGYKWEDIQAMQRGTYKPKLIK